MKVLKKQTPAHEQLLNGEVLERYNALQSVSDIHGFDVVWPLERNKEKLRIAIKANKLSQELAIPKSEAFKAYEADLILMYKQLTLQPDGSHKIKHIRDWNGAEKEVYDIDMNGPEYLSAKAALNLKHNAALIDRDAQFSQYNDFLSQPFQGTLDLHYVSESTFREFNPNISSRTLSLISWMIIPFSTE